MYKSNILIKKIVLIILPISLIMATIIYAILPETFTYAVTESERQELRDLLDEYEEDLGDLSELKEVVDKTYSDLDAALYVTDDLKEQLMEDIDLLDDVTGMDPAILLVLKVELQSQVNSLTNDNLSDMKDELGVIKEWVDEKVEDSGDTNNDGSETNSGSTSNENSEISTNSDDEDNDDTQGQLITTTSTSGSSSNTTNQATSSSSSSGSSSSSSTLTSGSTSSGSTSSTSTSSSTQAATTSTSSSLSSAASSYNTSATTSIPYTGKRENLIILIILAIGASVFSIIKYKQIELE